MSKFVKELEMKHVREQLQGRDSVLVINVIGMEAFEGNKLRLELRKKGIQIQVVKNSLARRIFADLGYPKMDSILEGPSAICYGGEGIVELAREISAWAKKLAKLQVKGGCVTGQAVDAAGVETLSKLPSKPELLGQIVGMLLGPASSVVAMLNGPAAQVASQLEKIAEKGEAAAVPAAEAAPAS